jgi:hypothetical protein
MIRVKNRELSGFPARRASRDSPADHAAAVADKMKSMLIHVYRPPHSFGGP